MIDFKPKIGLAVVSETFAKYDFIKEIYLKLKSLFAELKVDVITNDETVINCREVSKSIGQLFRGKGVDAIIVYLATYSQDNLIIDLVYPSNVAIALWAEEEPLNYPVPDIGAYCGMTQVGGVLNKMGKKFIMIDGKIEDDKNQKKLKKFLRVISLKKRLIYSKLGLIGSRSDGMLENVFNELELRNQVGPELIHISLSRFFNDMKKVDESELDRTIKKIFKDKYNIDLETIRESVKIYMVLKNIISEYSLSGITIKCWPELKENNICSPCFALSRIYDEGIPTACEADTTALTTMMIGDELSGQPTFLSDLLKIDDDKNSAYYYHCGCASTKLCNISSCLKYSKHPFIDVWKPGVIVEFPVKEGPITFARLGERNGDFQLVAYTGTSVSTELFVAGNVLLAVLDKKPSYVVDKLVEYGTEHHQITFYGNYLKELKIFSDFVGIKYFEI